MKLKISLLVLVLLLINVQQSYAAAAVDLSGYRELLDKESSGASKRPVVASKDLVKLTLAQAEDNYKESIKLLSSEGFNYSFDQSAGTRVWNPSIIYGRRDQELHTLIRFKSLLEYLRPAFEAGHFKAAGLLEILLGSGGYHGHAPSRELRAELIERDFVLRFIYNHPLSSATLRTLMLNKIAGNAKNIGKEERKIRNDGCGVHVGLCFFNTICGCGYCHWPIHDLCTDFLGRCCGAYV